MATWATPLGAVHALSSPSGGPTASAAHDPPGSRRRPILSQEQKLTFLKLAEALDDLERTQRGQSKTWLNVQPCVVHTNQLLIGACQEQEDRLTRAERGLQEAEHGLRVLASDARLKEERHGIEKSEQHQQFDELKVVCAQLSEALVAAERDRAEMQQEMRELLDRVTRLESQQAEREQAHQQQQYRSLREERSSSVRAARPHEPRRLRARQRRQDEGRTHKSEEANVDADKEEEEERPRSSDSNEAGLHERVLDEIAQLRAQWDRYFRRHDTHARGHRKGGAGVGTPSSSLLAPPSEPSGRAVSAAAFHDAAFFPPQQVRWYWSGDQASHFSRATQRCVCFTERAVQTRSASPSPASVWAEKRSAKRVVRSRSSSPAIAWDECRLHDARSGCWYSAGAWPCDVLLHPGGTTGVSAAPVGRGRRELSGEYEEYCQAVRAWGCYAWTRPASIQIARPGVYHFTLSLLVKGPAQSCGGGASSPPSTLLSRDAAALAGGASPISPSPSLRVPTLALYVDGSRVLTSSAAHSASPSALMLLPAADAAAAGHPPCRACCAPTQLASYTVSEYCHLERDAVLQVRCHGFHDTKATVEAFLELEYIV